jgi:hypothetical protein
MKSGNELPSADATASSVVRLLGCTASACLIPRPGGPGSGPVSGRGGASSAICPGRTFRSRGVASSSAGWPGFRRPGRARTKRPAMGTNTRSTSCPWSRSEAGCGGIDCETMVWCIISQFQRRPGRRRIVVELARRLRVHVILAGQDASVLSAPQSATSHGPGT